MKNFMNTKNKKSDITPELIQIFGILNKGKCN